MRQENSFYRLLPHLLAKALIIICLICLFIACHKDQIVTAKLPDQLIKTTLSTEAGISTETYYQYDIQGRIVRKNQTNPNCPRCGAELGNELNVYTYYKDKVAQTDKVSVDNSLTGKHAFTLAKGGFSIPDYLSTYNATFTHDDNGFLLLRQIPTLSGPTKFFTITQTIKDQNIIERSNNSGYDQTTTTYDYDVNHLSVLNPTGFLEESRQSKNLMTKETSTTEYREGTTLTVVTYYTYQFDKQGRVIERRSTTIKPYYKEPIVWIETFTYSN